MPQLVSIPVIAVLSACLLFAPLRAAACSVQEVTTDEEKFAKAKEVFLARVVRVEEAPKPERWGSVEFKAVQGTYKLLEVFKGEPKDGDTVLDFVFNPGNCSLGIMAGLYYVFLHPPGKPPGPVGRRLARVHQPRRLRAESRPRAISRAGQKART
jgi:hypothetical protein